MARWIPDAAIRAMHRELLSEHGGLDGSINEDMLGATLARPQQMEAYGSPEPTVFDLAAAYGFGFAKNHCFADGNKRIALAAIAVFLELNGWELVAQELDTATTINGLAAGLVAETDLAEWIKSNTQPFAWPE